MFLLNCPTDAQIRSFLLEREHDDFSYSDVGTSRDTAPAGYVIDHARALLGDSAEVFEAAKQAIRQWKMFNVPGMRLCYPDTPLEVGKNVAPLARHLGFYSLNACRIVYVIDEPNRFGFAYGTLTEHAECGEERFTVEFVPDTGGVWYDVFAFSRPGKLLVRLGYPYARYRQKRFSQDSKVAMLNATLDLLNSKSS